MRITTSATITAITKPQPPKPARKSGFPYFTKPSPLVAHAPRRFKSVSRLSEITALLEE